MKVIKQIEGRQLTTMRMGGPLRQFIETDRGTELLELARTFRSGQEPFIVIGSGSNMVFPSRAEKLSVIRFTGCTISENHPDSITVEGGCSISRLMGWSYSNGRSGLEFLIGIPGTLGGALAVNAGAFGESIGQRMISAEIIDTCGLVQTWTAADFSFSYRSGRIKYGQEIILRATLAVTHASRVNVGSRMREHIRYRLANHPASAPSAGCFFKNPKPGKDGISAGKLIDECGLKGLVSGDLQIAPRHANFILNHGRATLEQLNEFSRFITEQVKEKTGITLEREVIWITPDGCKY